MIKLSKKKRIRKKQLKQISNNGIVVNNAYNFLFNKKDNENDELYKDYI